MKITNKDIYSEIKSLRKLVDNNHESVGQKFDQVYYRLDQTNGKVKLNKWIATTALTMIMALIGTLLGTTIL